MSKKLTGLYAHLLNKFSSSPRAAEDDVNDEDMARWAKLAEDDEDRKRKDEESDEDYATRMRALDDEESDDSEKEDEKKEQAARVAERARCAVIFQSPHAAGAALPLAAHLAFHTDMSAAQAVATLATAPKLAADTERKPSGLAARMAAAAAIPNVGASSPERSGPANAAKAQADAILKAVAAYRGE